MKLERSVGEVLQALQGNETLRQHLNTLGAQGLLEKLAHDFATNRPNVQSATNPAALHAALCLTFTKGELAGTDAETEQVLSQSTVQTCEGLSRLTLNDEFRARILQQAQQQDELAPALSDTHVQDTDTLAEQAPSTTALESAWLRQFLRQPRVDLDRYRHLHVSAAHRARVALSFCGDMLTHQPALADVRRQLEWLELLEPMRLMIGAPPPSPLIVLAKDRFAGRSEELRQLRAFVDELASQSMGETFGRTISRLDRALSGKPRLMLIIARGGLGKSTLISKFAYDHAVTTRGMPFAYLDFDSASLLPKNPLLLLIEVARQVALFYPKEHELERFISHLRNQLLHAPSTLEADPFASFRRLVQHLINKHAARSFLLVLDTLELVQSDPLAMEGLVAFLRALAADDFSELAVVASGRAELPELSEALPQWSITTLQLESMTISDAQAMVQYLGESLLPQQWAPQWSSRIAGKPGHNARREPLSLRIAVEAVCHAPAETRQALVADIAAMGEDCDPASVDFVGRLYQKRILEHIADPYARRLAWPGLVARTISRTLAREVLAPVCELTPQQADLAFERLKREGWIVTPYGDDLRHHLELRARTLPLMRRHNAELFKTVCTLLSDYYRSQPNLGPAENAEADYYQLLADDSHATRVLDNEPTGTLQQLLLQRLDDFPANSQVAQDLKVRQASRPLPYLEFRELPVALAWRHFEQTGQALKSIRDSRVDPRILTLSHSLPWAHHGPLTAAQQTVLIKTGRWTELLERQFVPPRNRHDLQAATFLATFLTSLSSLDSQHWMSGFYSFLTVDNLAQWDWHSLAYALLPAYHASPNLYAQAERCLAGTLPAPGALKSTWLPTLRIVLAFGSESAKVAIEVMANHRNKLQPTDWRFSEAELDVLDSDFGLKTRQQPSRKSRWASYFKKDRRDDTQETATVLAELAELAELANSGDNQARQTLRRFALAGSPGLASPAGYVLALSGQRRDWLRHVVSLQLPSSPPKDMIQLAKFAEDQGALSTLLNEAMHHIREADTQENLELLEEISSHWGAGGLPSG